MKTSTNKFSRPYLKLPKTFRVWWFVSALILITLLQSSCSDHTNQAKEKNEKVDTLIAPVPIPAANPLVVNLDTCPPPSVITLSTPSKGQFIKQPSGNLLKLQPPEIKPADFLSLMPSYTSDQGLPIEMTLCGITDRKGNLWFGTIGGGVSRYDGKAFVNFTIAQGLGNDAVWSIAEDKNDNIWIGTYGGGVSRYDGKSFVNFNTSNGLTDNCVLSILEDSKGNLWFGTRNGLSRYDGKSFFKYKLQRSGDDIVWEIREDRKGKLWFGTNGGVFCYDGKSFTNLSVKDGLLSNTVRAIAEDQKGRLWFATEGGVSCCVNGVITSSYTTSQGLSHNNVRCIQEDKSGNMWFGTFGGGLTRYDGKSFTNYTTKQGLINNNVTGFVEDKAGNIWILTFGGMSCYIGEAFTNYTTRQGMSDNLVYGIMEDTKGNLWFNANSSGLLCYDGKSFTSYTVAQGFPNSPSTCTVEDRKGNLWFGTYVDGIGCFDGKSVTNYTTQQGLKGRAISCCLMDRKGNLWFGSPNGVVSCYNGKSFVNYAAAQGIHGNVTSLLEDHSGKLWIGTEGNGMYCYDGKFFTNYSIRQGLPHNNVRHVVEDNAGNLWIATDVGISRYDGRSFLNYATREGLPDKNATQLAITKEQYLAIGTNKGVALITSFIKKNKEEQVAETVPAQNALTNSMLKTYAPVFEIFNSATGYPVKDVNSGQGTIYKDHNGMLWIATGSDKTALARFDYAALHKMNVVPDVYIQRVKVNDEIVCWSDLNKNKALTHSLGVKDSSNVPVNITEEVTAFGVPLRDEERENLYQKFGDISFDSITRFYFIPENLVLPYKNNSITFDFAVIEPVRPYLVNYQYRLEGYDKDWSPVSNRSTATFGNIYEGTYVFKLKAQGPSGLWSEPVYYRFKVSPPWWRTWWMYTIYGMLLTGFVILIVRWYNKRLMVRAKMLAQEIKKATQEIVEQKKIVEEKNKLVEARNKDITDSINYALRIQKAFLPKKEEFYSNLPKSFILFKPKDIVSGDFYFFHKTFPINEHADRGLLFIAAVDCTGHGVPGAFLSMVGSERLTDAVQQSDNASEILSLLNKGVKNSLHQTGEDESTRDGMDIAICSLDVENRIVKYAGANRPLWLIRKGEDEVEEIKSTKVAVGGLTEEDQHFESHELELQEGDTFYIFSDGYADIFSGKSGKKLTTKKFKQLLLEIQTKTMQEQEHYLDRFIEDWKAGTEQIDDILVIGIRI